MSNNFKYSPIVMDKMTIDKIAEYIFQRTPHATEIEIPFHIYPNIFNNVANAEWVLDNSKSRGIDIEKECVWNGIRFVRGENTGLHP